MHLVGCNLELSLIQFMEDQKQPENGEYFNYMSSITTSGARCTCEVQYSSAMEKAALKKKILFTIKSDLNVRKKLVKLYNWSVVFLRC
jgi:hypothetical protein